MLHNWLFHSLAHTQYSTRTRPAAGEGEGGMDANSFAILLQRVRRPWGSISLHHSGGGAGGALALLALLALLAMLARELTA